MSRFPGGRRIIAGLLLSSLLFALAIVPGSGLNRSVAAATATCPPFEEARTCFLSIDGAPASVVAGQTFSFDVTLRDAPTLGNVVDTNCWSSANFTVNLNQDVTLQTKTSPASLGLAHFSFSVAAPGSYQFRASASSASCTDSVVPGYHSLIVTPGVTATCPPTTICTTPTITSPDGTTAAITAGPGATITASFSTLAQAGFTGCLGYPPPAPNSVLTFNVTNSRLPKLIKFVVNYPQPIRICWNAPNTFQQRGGGWASPDPLGGFTGLLPNCLVWRPTLPCAFPPVSQGGTSTVWVLAPAGDPKMY